MPRRSRIFVPPALATTGEEAEEEPANSQTVETVTEDEERFITMEAAEVDQFALPANIEDEHEAMMSRMDHSSEALRRRYPHLNLEGADMADPTPAITTTTTTTTTTAARTTTAATTSTAATGTRMTPQQAQPVSPGHMEGDDNNEEAVDGDLAGAGPGAIRGRGIARGTRGGRTWNVTRGEVDYLRGFNNQVQYMADLAREVKGIGSEAKKISTEMKNLVQAVTANSDAILTLARAMSGTGTGAAAAEPPLLGGTSAAPTSRTRGSGPRGRGRGAE